MFKLIKETKDTVFLIVPPGTLSTTFIVFYNENKEIVKEFTIERQYRIDLIISIPYEEYVKIRFFSDGKSNVNLSPFVVERIDYELTLIKPIDHDNAFAGLTKFSPRQYLLDKITDTKYSKKDVIFVFPESILDYKQSKSSKVSTLQQLIPSFFELKDLKNYYMSSQMVEWFDYNFLDKVIYCSLSGIDDIKNRISYFVKLIVLDVESNNNSDDGFTVSNYERKISRLKQSLKQRINVFKALSDDMLIDEDDKEFVTQQLEVLKSYVEKIK